MKRRDSSSYSHLSEADARAIKRRIWHGETAESLAAAYEISVSAIRGIVSGKRWSEIEWPSGDGLIKGLPKWRRDEIDLARKKARESSMTRTVRSILMKQDAEGVE